LELLFDYYDLINGSIAIIAAVPAILALWAISLLFLLLRWWKTGLSFLLVGLALNWYTQSIPVNPLAWRQVNTDQKEEGVIRIFEYNICHKDKYLSRNLERYQELADFILSQDADILVLPEHMGPHAVKLDSILRDHYPYNFSTLIHHGYEEDAVFSRYPVMLWDHYCGMMTYRMDLDVHGQPVTLVYVHLRSNGYDDAKKGEDRRRDKLRSVLESMNHSYAYRDAEAEAISDSLQHNQNPLLICGDFNDVSGSYVLKTLQHRLCLKDAWWERGLGPGFTFDDQHLLLRLDHLLYSSQFSLQGVALLSDADFSDHEPLLFDVRLATK